MRHVLAICIAAAAACVAEPTEELAAPPPGVGEPIDVEVYVAYESEQGRHILGSFPDSLTSGGDYFRVSVLPVNVPGFRLSVNAAGPYGAAGTHLVADDGPAPAADHQGADPWFIGTILTGAGGQLRIRDVRSAGDDIISTVYFLDYRSVTPGTFGPWVDYCGSAGGGAIPISGYYDSRRIHQPGPWLSFACRDGGGRKCNGWGYIAGNAGPGDPGWDHHQACTAMANADYCRQGTSYTREQTPILIRDLVPDYGKPSPTDLVHPMPFPGDPDKHYFEAAWRGLDLAPICLSRIRWAGLPPNPCPLELPDPRFTNGDRAKFCDDMTLADMQARGAKVFNASKMMDAPLQRWRNPASGDIVTTIRGYLLDRDGLPGADPDSTFPFPGYTQYGGTDSMILRNLPGTLSPSDMHEMRLQAHPMTGDLVVASAAVPDHVAIEFEGYAFRTPGAMPHLKALDVCKVGWDHRTTVAPPLGCSVVGRQGYALPAP